MLNINYVMVLLFYLGLKKRKASCPTKTIWKRERKQTCSLHLEEHNEQLVLWQKLGQWLLLELLGQQLQKQIPFQHHADTV